MKKVIYYSMLNYNPDSLALLKDAFSVVTLETPASLTPEILSDAHAVFAPLGYRCDEQIFSLAPYLHAVASNTTGHGHIDVEAAHTRNINVITLKNDFAFLEQISPTAELALGLIITLTRNIIPANASVVQRNIWERWPFGGERMLSTMTLGVIGMGRLGKKLARYGKALGMNVLWYDPFIADDKKNDGESLGNAYTRCETLEMLVSSADVVSLHVPHDASTEKMINAAVLEAFRRGSYFINTSRGELVDEKALLACLESGHLAGAALDVLADEFSPLFSQKVGDNLLVTYASMHSNLVITPHIGGSTRDAWRMTQQRTVEQLIAYCM